VLCLCCPLLLIPSTGLLSLAFTSCPNLTCFFLVSPFFISSSSELSHHEQQRSAGGEKSNSSKVLMHFFDDWPTSLQQSQNGVSNSTGTSSSVNLSMSTTRDQTSDFLRLSTGNGGEVSPRGSNGNIERDTARGWIGGGWGGSQLGGPLGEALRSSAANSSHSRTSVLHQLPRCSASDTSRVTA